jgi:hypothetical protein
VGRVDWEGVRAGKVRVSALPDWVWTGRRTVSRPSPASTPGAAGRAQASVARVRRRQSARACERVPGRADVAVEFRARSEEVSASAFRAHDGYLGFSTDYSIIILYSYFILFKFHQV